MKKYFWNSETKKLGIIPTAVIEVFVIFYAIPEKFKGEPRFYDMECTTDLNCWDSLINDFFGTMLLDLNDGVLDKDYYYGDWDHDHVGWYDINERINSIANENIQFEISEKLNEKLKNIEKSKQRVIMEEIGVQWF